MANNCCSSTLILLLFDSSNSPQCCFETWIKLSAVIAFSRFDCVQRQMSAFITFDSLISYYIGSLTLYSIRTEKQDDVFRTYLLKYSSRGHSEKQLFWASLLLYTQAYDFEFKLKMFLRQFYFYFWGLNVKFSTVFFFKLRDIGGKTSRSPYSKWSLPPIEINDTRRRNK